MIVYILAIVTKLFEKFWPHFKSFFQPKQEEAGERERSALARQLGLPAPQGPQGGQDPLEKFEWVSNSFKWYELIYILCIK